MGPVVNRETPLAELFGGVAMPTGRFYLRNHFPTPVGDPARWRLGVSGLVRRQPTLEDAFVKLVGRSMTEEEA